MPLLPLPPLPLSSHRHGLPFLSFPSSAGRPLRRGDLVIRMGGGPRTFPGGVSKWQWKRMQARKAKQLLKARLARERQLYEMRKRTELREAVLHLERPWDSDSSPVSATALAPNLLSIAADDQLKGLADRFHRPGGVDLWNDRDGPQVFASPETGKTSARFFPKNAVHSVQPYARLGAGADGAQGVRENDSAEDVHSDHEPTVELMERDGMWEPVIALDGEAGNNSVDWSWINDDVSSDSEDAEDVDLGQEQRAMARRDVRRSGVARGGTASTMAVGSDRGRDWRGHGSFSDSEGTRKGHLDQRWSDIRKPPTGRWKPSNTKGINAIGTSRMGGGSFSDSEVSRRGFEPKWSRRARSRDDTLDSSVKWKLSYDSHGNVIRKVRISGEFDSNPDSGRGDKSETKWRGRNRFNRSENQKGRPGSNYRTDANNNGERPRGYMSRNSGGNSFASDLDEPTWNPRKKKEAPNNYVNREYNRDMNGRSRRGGSGAARQLDAHPGMDINGEDGIDHDSRQRIWARLRGDEYSLRPTSELHGSVDRNGRRQFRGDGYSVRPTSDLR